MTIRMSLSGTQKLCLGLIILGSLAMIAGSAAPFWVAYKISFGKVGLGPWYYYGDTSSGSEVHTYKWADSSFDDFKVWFYVFHVTDGLGTLLSLILVFSGLAKVCGNPESVKGTGGLGLSAGLLGIAAAVVFYVETTDSLAIPASNDDSDWAFYVFASGSGLTALFGILLLVLPNASGTRVGVI